MADETKLVKYSEANSFKNTFNGSVDITVSGSIAASSPPTTFNKADFTAQSAQFAVDTTIGQFYITKDVFSGAPIEIITNSTDYLIYDTFFQDAVTSDGPIGYSDCRIYPYVEDNRIKVGATVFNLDTTSVNLTTTTYTVYYYAYEPIIDL